ncbi:tRNA uridine(34) 5-carboxymethylaminomethyl modification radical SAM/GNAT enzyme Elp3 [Candidatus Nomurabacteria bacterium]|nr:tRNA uridine(34) 5-carboxymethylaminomethyl modification radical SAM/GNAT enzyme Elp3 [Candidatus Nomurabacteria bacterium]
MDLTNSRFSTEQLETILFKLIEANPSTKDQVNFLRTKAAGDMKIQQPPNRLLLSAYQNLVKMKRVKPMPSLERLLRKADIRSTSGISVVTSLVKPYTCPGKCVYCPTEVRMPKSYIASEPAAARALRLDFSPYEQVKRRIEMLEVNGHPTDKVEYIIKGGTWNAYPLKYQYWFILESFRACNDLSRRKIDAPSNGKMVSLNENSPLEDLQTALEKEQRYNETAKHRIIGLTLETRPDAISAKSIHHMRLQGCTRIELGLQAPDDQILELIKRGHTVKQFEDAIYLLRCAGFKVDLHFMPDLPGTSPDHDIEMYQELFQRNTLKPDMVKIYPNTVIKSAELYKWFQSGKYKPYGEEGLFRALLQMKLDTPRYCRISRLIRDIPETEIEAGNKVTNLREALAAHLKKEGKQCVCLRCREISRQRGNIDESIDPVLFVDQYDTLGGAEYFITYEDPDRKAVYGFLRLRIPDSHAPTNTQTKKLYGLMPEIENCAFIRELHVYGKLVGIGKKEKKASQHKGIGAKLVEAAEKIVKDQKQKKIAIISGVGVRGYYRKFGYRKQGTYMTKKV